MPAADAAGMRHRSLIAIIAAALCGSLAVPAVAATPKAGTWKHVKVQRGYDLRFKVAGGKVTKVVARVLEECAGSSGTSTVTFAPEAAYAVKGGRFGKKTKESAGGVTLHLTFRGRFTSATRASGTLRMESVVAGSRCDTYTLKWTAKRG
jgi:hypothetical protein